MKIAVSALLLLASIHIAGGWAAAQNAVISNQIRSAFLLNFARFVDWPDSSALRKTPFTLCTATDTLQGALENTIRGETVRGRPIQLRRVTEAGNVKGCHLLYVTGRQTAAMIEAASGTPVLTVGETAEFMKLGGMIRFVEMANRIRFEINHSAAERAGLRVSSRLLRLADIVEGEP
jgi:hypothetical protein